MGSAIVGVSVFILSMVIASLALVTALSEVEDDASGAVGWLPLSTIARLIPLLVAFFPPMTSASAIGGTAPLLIRRKIPLGKIGVATEAQFIRTRAHIAAPPVARHQAAIPGLVIMREEED